MKKALVLLVMVCAVGSVQAQDFVKGGNYIHIGYGLDPWGHPGVGNAFGTYKKSVIGPVMVGYEVGVTDVLGIGRIGAGGVLAQSWYTQKYSSGNTESIYRTSRFSIIPRATYHFEFDIPKMDVYAGVGAAIHIIGQKDRVYNPLYGNPFFPGEPEYIESSSSTLRVGHYVFGGIRYYFTDAFAVYAEAGHGVSAINGGVVFAF